MVQTARVAEVTTIVFGESMLRYEEMLKLESPKTLEGKALKSKEIV